MEPPEPEYFLSPGTDVLEGHEGLDDDPILRDRRLLGVYIPMHSPGRVMLFRHRLRQAPTGSWCNDCGMACLIYPLL